MHGIGNDLMGPTKGQHQKHNGHTIGGMSITHVRPSAHIGLGRTQFQTRRFSLGIGRHKDARQRGDPESRPHEGRSQRFHGQQHQSLVDLQEVIVVVFEVAAVVAVVV